MSDIRQMPLFPAQPLSPDDINRHTALNATLLLFENYLVKEGKSQHTIKAFAADMHLFAEYTSGITPVGQYTTTHINQFLHWMEFGRGIPCSRKTYARRVTTIKVYFKWLYSIGSIPHDPARAVLQRSGPAPLSHVLTPEQIAAAMDFSQRMKRGDEVDFRPEMLFRLLLDTGIKKGEAMTLQPGDVDRSSAQSPILSIKHKVKNIYKERRIELDPEWVKLMEVYLGQYQPKDSLFNCTARNLEYILTDIGEGAEIPFKLSFEVMRWSCAVRDYRSGMEEELIREKLGLSRTSWYETGAKIKRLALEQAGGEFE